jgi:thiol-disulfide isomerase/thioredoxin
MICQGTEPDSALENWRVPHLANASYGLSLHSVYFGQIRQMISLSGAVFPEYFASVIAAIRCGRRRARPAKCVLVAAVSVMVAVCAACSTLAPAAETHSDSNPLGVTVFPSSARRPLPDLGATTLSGTHRQLRSFVGHGVVVLNVWASWCTECRAESPVLAALAREFGGQGVTFVGVDEQDSASKARSFARSTGMSYTHLVDPDGSLLAKLTALPNFGIPSSLFIDPHGNMAARIVGAASAAQVRALIAQIG